MDWWWHPVVVPVLEGERVAEVAARLRVESLLLGCRGRLRHKGLLVVLHREHWCGVVDRWQQR